MARWLVGIQYTYFSRVELQLSPLSRLSLPPLSLSLSLPPHPLFISGSLSVCVQSMCTCNRGCMCACVHASVCACVPACVSDSVYKYNEICTVSQFSNWHRPTKNGIYEYSTKITKSPHCLVKAYNVIFWLTPSRAGWRLIPFLEIQHPKCPTFRS